MAIETKTKRAGFDFWREDLKGAKYVVAPMVDQSELAWRMLSRRYGGELCYTPMLHSSIFLRDPIYRRDAMALCAEDRPLIVQFCANDPEVLLKAAKMVENDCDAVDLNIGCPQGIAKRGHYGSFLQDEWDLLHDMVSLCAKELKVPITCKIRIFEDIDKTVKYAQMLEKAGAQLLTVHGRRREQKGIHTGLADWKYITAVRQNVKIPVFANGNIQSLSDVHRCLEETGAQGVMSAEGNLHDPAIFTGRRFHVCRMAREYLELVEIYPCPASFVRGHLFKLLHHALAKFTQYRETLALCKKLEEFKAVVRSVEELCLPDVELYESEKSIPTNDDNIPYWLCQPYVRPEPKTDAPSSKRPMSPLSEQNTDEAEQVSLDDDLPPGNEAKKIKTAEEENRVAQAKKKKFEVCPCGQPKRLKCTFEMCRACCKIAVFKSLTDCPGHKLFVKKENREKRRNIESTNNEALNQTTDDSCRELKSEDGNFNDIF